MDMELRHLRYFVAVAEEGHVTRAAERLGIRQPPLSQQIAALERELGARLFTRLPRGVALTDSGRAFLDDARAALAQVERAATRARRAARGEIGSVAVGFTSSAPFHPLVPGTLRRFRENHAGVALALEEASTGDLVAAVRGERLDVAFIRSAVADAEGLRLHALADEEMVVAAPSAHPLARAAGRRAAPPVALRALAAEPFILYRRPAGPGLHDAIIAACSKAGFVPQVAQEAPRIVSTLNLVAAGLGVTLVPESLARLRLDGVAYLRLDGRPAVRAPLALAARRREASAAVLGFIALARRLAGGRAS
ncbi:MAG: LysR family transcriptional regulator [Rhodospirillales bacterium]|nr:MAG: LysR family transcriptional regulator [Rhodospirillales bacterium]